jgi:hypothetical protein
LEYGSVATARARKSALAHLELAERRALRFAIRPPPRTSNVELYLAANLEPVSRRIAALRERAILRFGNSQRVQHITTIDNRLKKNISPSKR